nr:cyclophilin-like fold protein [uncultured Desulfuromonas sp.]
MTNNTVATDDALGKKEFAVTLTVGGTVIPAVLNGSRSARELLSRLPYTVQLHKYEHDYCGVMAEPLPYDDQNLQNGWSNGDIAFAADGSYFAILYKDEEISQQFGNLVTLGNITAPLGVMDTLNDVVTVTIERQ